MKVVYIMRGISGSGKSTVAQKLAHLPGLICSTDSYFMDKGVYKFDRSKLGEYHNRNFEFFSTLLEMNVPTIVVDNTNCKRKEFERYVTQAEANGYEVIEVTVGNPWKTVHGKNGEKARVLDEEYVKKCAARNSHNVPLDVVMQQARNFEV